MRLVNQTEREQTPCRLCEKIETKHRRRIAEKERLDRWQREGSNLVASMDKSKNTILELEKEIAALNSERISQRTQMIGRS